MWKHDSRHTYYEHLIFPLKSCVVERNQHKGFQLISSRQDVCLMSDGVGAYIRKQDLLPSMGFIIDMVSPIDRVQVECVRYPDFYGIVTSP
jgi:hypothetical protein